MSGRRRICVVSGSRAEYGLLYWVLKGIQAHPLLHLRMVVTGMHLSPEFGLTYRDIEADGFVIDAKVEMLLSSDTAVGVAKSVGLGTIGFADTFERLAPDTVLLWGDRYEALAAAQAALLAGIPIVHVGGGDVTEGAFDEATRHAISKMAHLHFPICAESARRLRQLGEDPRRIHDVGSAGLDHLRRLTLLDRAEVERRLNFPLRPRNLLVTYHPVTWNREENKDGLDALLQALDALGDQVGIIVTKPNADNDSRAIIARLDAFAATRPHMVVRASLGSHLYLSTAALCDAVVGNSSSGLVEIPSLGTPTVNIGQRQQGRPQARSVISCTASRESIAIAIDQALERGRERVENPFGDGYAADRIVAILASIEDWSSLRGKAFFDLPIPADQCPPPRAPFVKENT